MIQLLGITPGTIGTGFTFPKISFARLHMAECLEVCVYVIIPCVCIYINIYDICLFMYIHIFIYTIYEATLHLKVRPSPGSPVACSCCNKTLAETPAIPKILKQRELRSMPGRSNYRNRIHKHMCPEQDFSPTVTRRDPDRVKAGGSGPELLQGRIVRVSKGRVF